MPDIQHSLKEQLLGDPFVIQLQEKLRQMESGYILPVGARTKSALSRSEQSEPFLMAGFRGITAYDPSEFLITARAGTPIVELQQALAEQGQYLPFDPLWSNQGATLGGTIAAGVSGPDRLLYGGLRDFVMEIAMIDGLGNLVRGGGKVVKNAAGFDTPKMMVGSYGRMGILLEATLKVFPQPQSYQTLLVDTPSIQDAIEVMQRLLSKSLPTAGLQIDQCHRVSVRVAGPSASMSGVAQSLKALLPKGLSVSVVEADQSIRQQQTDWLEHADDGESALVRVAVSPQSVASLHNILGQFESCQWLHLGACSISWIKLPNALTQKLDLLLQELRLSGVVIRGAVAQVFLGNRKWQELAQRIQIAIDPNSKFLPWSR